MKTYEFTITVVGDGETEAEAWDDARQAAEQKAADAEYDNAKIIGETDQD